MSKGSEGLFSDGPLLTMERFEGILKSRASWAESQSPGNREGNEWNRSRKAAEERTLPSHTA